MASSDALPGPRRPRPLSPHLSIYRPTMTMAMSIAHRISGVALYIGVLLLAWFLIAASADASSFRRLFRFPRFVRRTSRAVRRHLGALSSPRRRRSSHLLGCRLRPRCAVARPDGVGDLDRRLHVDGPRMDHRPGGSVGENRNWSTIQAICAPPSVGSGFLARRASGTTEAWLIHVTSVALMPLIDRLRLADGRPPAQGL